MCKGVKKSFLLGQSNVKWYIYRLLELILQQYILQQYIIQLTNQSKAQVGGKYNRKKPRRRY